MAEHQSILTRNAQLEDIVQVVDSMLAGIISQGGQMILPGVSSYMVEWYAVFNGKIIDGRLKKSVPMGEFNKEIDSIETEARDVIVLCLSNPDYRKFAGLMKQRSSYSGDVTRGWGASHHIGGGKALTVYTYGRNPFRAPLEDLSFEPKSA